MKPKFGPHSVSGFVIYYMPMLEKAHPWDIINTKILHSTTSPFPTTTISHTITFWGKTLLGKKAQEERSKTLPSGW